MVSMRKITTILALTASSLVLAVPAGAQSNGGPGTMMGPGMMGPGMMGPGMMGPGMMGPNGCPHCGMMWNQRQANLSLSVADVRANLEQWLQWNQNSRLKVGRVVETDANTITADIVTAEGNSLVERYTVDRHSGFYRPAH